MKAIMQFYILLNIKEVNSNQFFELNNILLFLTSMRVKMYYFNTMLKLYKKTTMSNQPSVVELLSF